MTGRIRTIKPELLEDERTGNLSPEAFKLFVGAILRADDHGNLRAQPSLIERQIFCFAPPSRDIRDLLAELSRASLVGLYADSGQAYAHVCGWARHQRVDKPGRPRVPKPTAQDMSRFSHFRETLATVSGDSPDTLATDLRPPTSDPDHRPRACSSDSPAPPSDARSGSSTEGAETPSGPDASAAAPGGPSEAESDHAATSDPADGEAAVKAKPGATAEVHAVFEAWRSLHATLRSKLDPKRAARIRARLAEGWTVAELETALRGALLDDWLMGRDPKTSGRAYRGLETLLRDSAQVERLKALHEAARRPGAPVVRAMGRATQTVDPVTGYVSVTDHRGLPAQGYNPNAPWLRGILTPLPADEPGNDAGPDVEPAEAHRVAG